MGTVFVVKSGNRPEPMDVVLCKDEDKELQQLLLNTPQLLPGDQIEPDAPCRWLLIRREMPVPDPITGSTRWSVDFLFADQNATPTFVECKRALDTRARREVVGQVLEYAANGQYYWRAADLRAHAEAAATGANATLKDALRQLQSEYAESADSFFSEVERKLKAGEVRVVFFLEQAPAELKRLVEFLNREMKNVEVLLVEARQFRSDGITVVVPTLFGFTEQIRELKRAAASERGTQYAATDWDSFRSNAEKNGMKEADIVVMRRAFDTCKDLKADVVFGTGKVMGSFRPIWRSIASSGAPLAWYADGKMEPHFPQCQASEAGRRFAATFAQGLTAAGLQLPTDSSKNWFSYSFSDWAPKAEVVLKALTSAVDASLATAPTSAQERG